MSNFKNKKVLSALLSLSLAFEPMALAQNNPKIKSEQSLCNKIVQKAKKVVTHPGFYVPVGIVGAGVTYLTCKAIYNTSRVNNESIEARVGYNSLDKNEKIIYDIIIKNCDFKNLNIIKDKEYAFKISEKINQKLKNFFQDNYNKEMEEYDIFILNRNKTEKIYGAIILDHPELYWVNLIIICYDNHTLEVMVYSNFSKDEIESKKIELENKVSEILNKMNSEIGENATDYDKAKYINDYIHENCKYSTKESGTEKEKEKVHTAYGCLCEGEAVCDGISKAYQLLMNRAGVDCRTISGTSEEGKGLHAWNIIKINGEWKHIDVTWNLTRSRGKNGYFLLTNEEIQKDHRIGIPYGNGNDEYINANGHRNCNLPKEIAKDIKVYY